MIIRKIIENDRAQVLAMMREFYASDAVYTNGSEEIFERDIDECISPSPYADGYVLEKGCEVIGYGMIARSYSTEFGRRCVWIEDIYIRAEYRGCGYGTRFIEYIKSENPGALLRLEAEVENEPALSVYKKCGFDFLPYLEMKNLI